MISWKGGLVLLAVLAGLAVYAYNTRPHPSDGPQINSLIRCGAPDAVDLTIEGGGRLVQFQRQSVRDDWRLVRPSQAEVDPTAMDILVSSVHSIEAQNTIKNPAPAILAGFQKPRETVTCRVASGSSYTLSVGGESFDGAGYYARRGGDSAVYVISSVQVDAFDRNLASPPVKQPPLPSGGPSPTPTHT